MRLTVTSIVATEKWLKHLRDTIKANGYYVQIGFLGGGSYAKKGTSIPYVAYLNEFGVHNPGRPFLQRTLNEKGKEWQQEFAGVISGNTSSSQIISGLKLIGERGKADVVKTIRNWPHSDPRANKDDSRPLIKTTTMITNVKSQVKK